MKCDTNELCDILISVKGIDTVVTADSSSLQLSIVAIGFHVFRTIEVNRLLGELLKHPNTYADFEFLAFWQTQYNNMNAVNLFFAWIKVLWGVWEVLGFQCQTSSSGYFWG